MDLKQLTYLVAVADTGSFTAAARRHHVAQSAISMAIARLEQRLELKLFERQERRIRITPEGEVLLAHARRLLQQAERAEREMEELKSLVRGEVRIGIPFMMGSYFFPPILMAFKHRYPGLRIEVDEAGTRELLSRMATGELDLAILIASDLPGELMGARLVREEMVAVVGEEHPWRGKSGITLGTFFEEELALFRQGFYHREHMESLATEAGVTPRIAFESNLIPLHKAVVRQGFAVSTLLRMAIEEDDDLFAVPFIPPIYLDLCVAWHRDETLSRANRALRDFLLEQCERA
ncbi:LysR family transcriptional regulator [Aeromonas schubertii]|uniref:LysR family transcriptional regulator n=1 Tax=Aeromonas schubertii TaxID=652 RepID=A0ABS7VEM0_9GAMM|nr:LysR family transcriptional regulator [Aeromonas schubertii]KUE81618.1 LysR family transcriptional regulator [Aeromonas schubertii]MBZ6067443.1 LysR family transcriptional regulator [Aeromonas schubertii]